MLRALLRCCIAAACLFVLAPAHADILTLVEDELDARDLIQQAQQRPLVSVNKQDVERLRRILSGRRKSGVEALLGDPLPMAKKTYAMPVGQPRMIGLSGLRHADPEKNRDHVAFYALGPDAGLRVYYGVDGESVETVLIYLRAGDGFPRLREDNLQERLDWEAARLAAIEAVLEKRRRIATRPYLKSAGVSVPPGLNIAYHELVAAMRARDADAIERHVLPGSVRVTTAERPEGQREHGTDLNLPFGAAHFTPEVITVRRERDGVLLLRTGTSYLRFVRTHSAGWKLYHYGDKPIR